jgi:predicted amidohydrolase YtcJ
MPTLVLTNAIIHTLDPRQPRAEALAIRNGRLLAIGRNDTIRALARPHTELIDLGGRCVVPGLIDAHVHFRNFALALQQVDLMNVPGRDEALRRIAARVATATADQWIEGWGWMQDNWPDRAFPTAAQLDAVTPDHPALLRHKSGHAAWVNTVALRLAGIDATTPDPPGGEIGRYPDGQPNGVLFESAMELVSRHRPPLDQSRLIAALRQAQQHCWQVGLVGLHDFDGSDCFRALQTLHAGGELGLRIVKNIPAELIDHAVAVGLQSGFGDDWLRIGGIKIFADGALGPRTAAMLAPYEGEPHNRGIILTEKEEMMQIAHTALAHRLALTVHAIGDRAVHDVLDVYEVAQAAFPQRQRAIPNRIEHVQVIDPADYPRLAALGVVASVQPTHATSDMEMVDRYWGARGQHAYAFRTLLETGATVVFGSDCPIEAIDPLPGIHAAVTRRRADGTPGRDGWYGAQRFSVMQALRAFTLAAAETSGQADRFGSLVAGKSADLTIFSRDLCAIPPDELLDVAVSATVVAGTFRHRTF